MDSSGYKQIEKSIYIHIFTNNTFFLTLYAFYKTLQTIKIMNTNSIFLYILVSIVRTLNIINAMRISLRHTTYVDVSNGIHSVDTLYE